MDANQIKTAQVEVKNATQEQKLTAIVEYLDAISRFQEVQAKRLSSINTILVILFVLFIIGLLLQSCSVL